MTSQLKRLRTLGLGACCGVLLSLLAGPAPAHEDAPHPEQDQAGPPLIYGVLDFPNSGAPAAQDAFRRGVLLLHSFEYTDANQAFREAQALDPGFVMAIWGEAMTHNHPLWGRQNRQEALRVLEKLPPAEQRTASDREQRFLAAVQTLYGREPDVRPLDPLPPKPDRDRAYMAAMQAIAAAYPDDLEAAAFHALAILGSVVERDFRTYMRAAAILEEVFAQQPQHPGAAHYLIHSYDDQVHAPLGLRAARVYANIAPNASHAQHMISHIYTSLGMWDEVVAANINAVRVSEESLRRAGKPVTGRSKHALHWLYYALLQQGRYAEANDQLAVMQADYAADPTSLQHLHYVIMRANQLVDDPTTRQPLPASGHGVLTTDLIAIQRFASGFWHLTQGQADAARQEDAALQAAIANTRVVMPEEGLYEDETATSAEALQVAGLIATQLEALLACEQGDTDHALELLNTAVVRENARALEYGPPYIVKPSSELLGELLLQLDRPAEAVPQFENALLRSTRRSQSLLGLARAQQASGDQAGADQTWQLLADQWKGDLDPFTSTGYPWLRCHS